MSGIATASVLTALPAHEHDWRLRDTEDVDGVWASAAANMSTYILLAERAAAYRADPEVQAAFTASRVLELSEPTLAAGETLTDLLADRSAFEDVDADALAEAGYAFVALNQLAVEHALGAR